MVKKERSIDFVFRVETFASDVLQARIELNVTQYQVAREIDMSATWVSDVENGQQPNMKIQHFLALCNLLDLNPANYWELKS